MGKKIFLFLASSFLASAVLLAQEAPLTPAVTITAKRGKTFSITLESNATTGYQWQLQPLDTTLIKFLHTKYRKNKSRRLGASSKETWTFRAMDRGTATIKLHCVRPWETDTGPIRIVTLTVVIQ
ncbi:MAG: protease inhibitor I42 family protein [Candidatus Omnitrophota bacterium]|nr:protease inhibitor I42 family protein [Candidatus Omnitrophota bacterium]